MSAPRVSIIVCTANREQHLRQTLDSLARVCVPSGASCELLVVDNASTDGTAGVVQACRLPNLPVRLIHEPRQGKGFAYNAGLAAAQGEVILFTDDDVRPPTDWIAGTCAPILWGKAHAVAGGVRLAPHLLRPWMEDWHRGALADTGWLDPDAPYSMVGANMAFSRTVLDKVPQFDPALGPGALGFYDETFFSRQIKEAGFTLGTALDVQVEHHFEPDRLLRSSFLSTAKKHGQSLAYIAHHWEHQEIRGPGRKLLKRRALLGAGRLRRRGDCLAPEGISKWEFDLLQDVHFFRHYLSLRRQPRLYEKHGFVKRSAPT